MWKWTYQNTQRDLTPLSLNSKILSLRGNLHGAFLSSPHFGRTNPLKNVAFSTEK